MADEEMLLLVYITECSQEDSLVNWRDLNGKVDFRLFFYKL